MQLFLYESKSFVNFGIPNYLNFLLYENIFIFQSGNLETNISVNSLNNC